MVIGHTLHGAGPQGVIVLHGWMGDYSVFRPMFNFLDTDTFTYAFVDYRGYGKSKEIGGDYTMAEIAADALALADHL
ncbi:MAG: alpha/beta hydrolase, partial [Alphaproteobacteria bacterium]|nr:alpha/beta hydrolase [Alphaproteobacteria bacterium]